MDLSKLSDSDLLALQSGDLSKVSDEGLASLSGAPAAPEEPGLGMKALSAIGSGLDYAGGVTRAAAANVADAVVPGEIATKEDLLNALKGNAPGTAEYLERSGVPAGYSLSDALGDKLYSETGDELLKFKKGGALDPTARGAAGFVGDVALDPLTYLSFGASAAAKAASKGAKLGPKSKALANLRPYLNPIETAAESAGKKYYKSAFKGIDETLAQAGKGPISEELFESGFRGNMRDALRESKNLKSKAGSEIGSVYKEGAEAGLTAPMSKVTSEASDIVSKMKKSPNVDVVSGADKLDELVKGYAQRGEAVPLDQLHAWGTEARQLANPRFFDPNVSRVPYKDDILGSIGMSASKVGKESLEGTPELLDRLEKANQTYATTKTATQKGGPLLSAARAESKKNPITVIDLMLAGGATLNPYSLGVLATKKAGEKIMSTSGKTNIGKALNVTGKNAAGLMDSGSRRTLLELLNAYEENKK